MSFREKTISTLKWSSIEKIGQFAAQLVISITLARLLDAQIYGLIGIINIFIIICSAITDAGFSQGLIRKLDCTNEDYNSVFWFNCVMGGVLYSVLYFVAPCIALFFNNPELTLLSRVLFLVIPLSSLNVIQITKINKELKFRTIAVYSVLATVLSGILGVCLAVFGYGVWALVWQTIAFSALQVLFFSISSDWHPKFRFSIAPIKELLPFSSLLFASSFLNSLFNNLYTFIVAKLYSEAQLGYYTQANKFATQPTNLIENILNRMVYPLFAQIQNDIPAYLNAYRKVQVALFSFVLPMMVLLALCAPEGIVFVLGEKWAGSVFYFQLMCIAGITLPLHPLCTSTLKVFGLSKLIFKLEVVKKILIVVLVLATLKYGVVGLVWSQVVFFWIALVINMYYGGKQITYTLGQQIMDILPSLGIALVAFGLSSITSFFFDNLLMTFILKMTIFISSYLAALFLFKLPQGAIVKSLFTKFVRR